MQRENAERPKVVCKELNTNAHGSIRMKSETNADIADPPVQLVRNSLTNVPHGCGDALCCVASGEHRHC